MGATAQDTDLTDLKTFRLGKVDTPLWNQKADKMLQCQAAAKTALLLKSRQG